MKEISKPQETKERQRVQSASGVQSAFNLEHIIKDWIDRYTKIYQTKYIYII